MRRGKKGNPSPRDGRKEREPRSTREKAKDMEVRQKRPTVTGLQGLQSQYLDSIFQPTLLQISRGIISNLASINQKLTNDAIDDCGNGEIGERQGAFHTHPIKHLKGEISLVMSKIPSQTRK